MGSRLDLQELFETIVENVYFQPPPSISLSYPCIVYQLDDIDIKYANNSPYKHKNGYMVTLIDQNPDSALLTVISALEGARFDRFYAANNLNHYVFRLYF